MKRAILALIVLAVVAGAVVGAGYYQNKVADNTDVLMRAQGAVYVAAGCVDENRKEAGRVACLIRSMDVKRSLGGHKIHFEVSKAPSLARLPFDITCTRKLWIAGSYDCKPAGAPVATK